MDPIKAIEQEHLDLKDCSLIANLGLNLWPVKDQVKYLGLDHNYTASYYIGATWLKEGETALVVHPKVDNLDVMAMFQQCLKNNVLNEHLSKIYHIDYNSEAIKLEVNPCDITPMLLLHFVSVVQKLASKGLKKEYIRREENLQSKVKGKIKFNQHFKKNIARGRHDKIYCNYQDYSVDCLVNQLLKKTLLFTNTYLARYYNKKEILVAVNACLAAFDGVSSEVSPMMIKRVKVNPVFKEYAEAIRLAKLILRHFSYSLSNIETKKTNKVKPYWIDMSLLFEIYVYGKLRDKFKSNIKYQPNGSYGNVDFIKTSDDDILEDKMIIDTKYKPIYRESKYDIDNIRQISGYARDVGLRKKLKVKKGEMVPCCIIYPSQERATCFNKQSLKEEQITQFEDFWKVGIALPTL